MDEGQAYNNGKIIQIYTKFFEPTFPNLDSSMSMHDNAFVHANSLQKKYDVNQAD